MQQLVWAVALVATLILVSRGLPSRRWPPILAATLAVILLVVMAEHYGFWPTALRVR